MRRLAPARWSLRARLVALGLVISLVPVAVASALAAWRSRAVVEGSAIALLEARADWLASELDGFHRAYLGIAGRFARRAPSLLDAPGGEAELVATARRLMDADPAVRGLYVASPDGRVLVGTDGAEDDLARYGYFRRALGGSATVSDVFLRDALGGPVPFIAYAYPVGPPGRAPRGVLVMHVQAGAFWEAVRSGNGRAGPGSFSVLFDRAGVRIAHSFNQDELFRPAGRLDPATVEALVAERRYGERTRELATSPVEVPDEFARARAPSLPARGSFRTWSPANNARNVVVARRLRTAPWTLFYLAPEAEVLRPIGELVRISAAAVAVLVALGLAITLLLSRAILEPLRALVAAAERVARGDLGARVAPLPGAELALLGERFNGMVGSLRAHQEELDALVRARTAELERANAELEEQRRELVAQADELRVQGEELTRKNAAVERADQLKSEFLANMSHELRTPLNSIIGFSELLLDDAADRLGERHARYLQDVLASGRHLLELINDILDLSKIEAGRMDLRLAPVHAADVIADAVTTVRPMADAKRIELRVRVDARRPCRADERRLRQVLLNLLTNAVKFSPDGSPVDVLAEDVGAALRFSVRDRGIGIGEEFRARLFEPFAQGEDPMVKRHQGTGLGLAISRRIVVLHGGAFDVQSALGEGSTFSFTVPAEPPRASAAPLEFAPAPRDARVLREEVLRAAGGAPVRVLVIDDDPRVATLLRAALEPEGCVVTAAEGGREGVEAARASPPDLAVVDIRMPGMSGFEVIAELRHDPATARVPILVLTAAELSDAVRARLKREVLAFAEKGDVTRESLLAVLEDATGRSGSHDAAGPVPAARKVLVVDDHDLNRALARGVLERLGYEVIEAGDGPSGVDAARRERPRLVLLDLAMPGMDGFEVLEALRSDPATARLTVVALTAMAMRGDEERVRAAGFDGYLTKPLDRRALDEVLLRLADPPSHARENE